MIPRTITLNVVTPTAPAWYRNATQGQWTQVSEVSSWLSLSASGVHTLTGSALSGIMSEYSGAVLNKSGLVPLGGTFEAGNWLVVWGGGRTYSDNGIYAFGPLQATSPRWVCVKRGDSPAPSNARGCARHTYNDIQWIPTNRLFSSFTAGMYPSDGSNPWVDEYDFTTGIWTPLPDTLMSAITNYEGCTIYDSNRNCVWRRPKSSGAQFAKHDLNTYAWTHTLRGGLDSSHNPMAAYDPVRDIMFVVKGKYMTNPTYGFERWDLNTITRYNLTVSGAAIPESDHCTVFNPTKNRFVVWPVSGGKTIYEVESPTTLTDAWPMVAVTPAAGAIPPAVVNSAYGRFQYIPPPTEGYLLVANTTAAPYFYKV